MEAIRAELGVDKLTLFGISYGTELAIAYARAYPQHVERLILDSVVDSDDPDPFFTVGFRAMGPSLKSLCPLRCRYLTPDPGAELGQLVAKLRAQPMRAAVYDARGRSHRMNITPVALFDLMFLTRLPPAAARDAADRRARGARGRRRAARAAAARIHALRRARLAARLLGRPLRDRRARPTPCRGTPERRSISARRSSSSGSRRSRRARSHPSTPASSPRTRSTSACAGRTSRAPPRPTPAPPYPERPDADPAGRGGPPHAARVVGAHPAADPRRGAARHPRRRAFDGQRRAPARSTRSPTSRVTARPPSSCPRLPTGMPGGRAAARELRVAARLSRAAAQGRAHRARGRGDDRRPPARALPGGAGDLRRRPARRLVGAPRRPPDPARLPGRPRRHGVRRRSTGPSGCASPAPRPRAGRSRSPGAASRAARRAADLRPRPRAARQPRRRAAPVGALTSRPAVTSTARASASEGDRPGRVVTCDVLASSSARGRQQLAGSCRSRQLSRRRAPGWTLVDRRARRVRTRVSRPRASGHQNSASPCSAVRAPPRARADRQSAVQARFTLCDHLDGRRHRPGLFAPHRLDLARIVVRRPATRAFAPALRAQRVACDVTHSASPWRVSATALASASPRAWHRRALSLLAPLALAACGGRPASQLRPARVIATARSPAARPPRRAARTDLTGPRVMTERTHGRELFDVRRHGARPRPRRGLRQRPALRRDRRRANRDGRLPAARRRDLVLPDPRPDRRRPRHAPAHPGAAAWRQAVADLRPTLRDRVPHRAAPGSGRPGRTSPLPAASPAPPVCPSDASEPRRPRGWTTTVRPRTPRSRSSCPASGSARRRAVGSHTRIDRLSGTRFAAGASRSVSG